MDPTDAGDLVGAAGFRLDLPINRSCEADGRLSLRIGPDEWVLLGADQHSEQLERHLTDALGARFFSLVDISHRNLAFELSGEASRAVINGGCALDMSDSAFPAASATRTLFGEAEIVLIRGLHGAAYRLECWRSFAPYVYGLLKEIAREFDGH